MGLDGVESFCSSGNVAVVKLGYDVRGDLETHFSFLQSHTTYIANKKITPVDTTQYHQ
jgi:hypothetical protein